MSFAWPWLALLWPLIFLVPKKPKTATGGALDHPYLMALGIQSQEQQTTSIWQRLLITVVWTLLMLSIIRPQWIGEPVQNAVSGRSLYLSVDLSESMLQNDMQWNGRTINRYQAVQGVVGDFIENRQGDFIGLVVFGSFAEIQAPLTPDTKAVQKILEDLLPGMAGGSTAIGDGLALAVKQLRESDSPDKVIILLSDGENRTGNVTPEQATVIAKQSDIKVYTIGFGGNPSGIRRILNGSEIDETTLQSIASETKGEYYRATSTEDLAAVFKRIDQLESFEKETQTLRIITELYWLPLMMSVLIMALNQLTNIIQTRRLHDTP